MNHTRQNKVLLIGLDGLTWDVLNPLIDRGIMPNIRKIIPEAASGQLQSVMPPVTGPSWLSMATGLNPGKTGVFDFIKFNRKNFTLSPITSDDYRGRSLWDILSNKNKRSLIFNFPMLCPSYPINGVMTSGLGYRDIDKISYPKGYLNNIIAKFQDYKITVPYNLSKYRDNEKLFFQDIESLLSQYRQVLTKVLSNESFDLLVFIFSATDFVLHYAWKYWDKTHFAYKEDKKVLSMLNDFWRKMDDLIGCIYDYSLRERFHLLLISDHGFGKQDEIFRVNSWLVEKGYLKLRKKRVLFEKIERKMADSLKMVDKFTRQDFYTKIKMKTGRKKIDFFKQFDLENSKAFGGMHSDVVSGIYVIDQKNKEKVRNDILRQIEEEQSRNKIKVNVLFPTEIYSGKYIGTAPDILLYIDDFRCSMNSISLSKNYYERQKIPHLNKTGTHRLNGIFIGAGPKIRKNFTLENAKILDICPTILYLMGLEIPSNVDGGVLGDIFTEDFLNKNDMRYFTMETDSIRQATDIEAERIVDTLESLGYM